MSHTGFPVNALTLSGDRNGIRSTKSCWWWWFDRSFARLIAPVVTTTSIILCFYEHRLTTQVHLQRERERETDRQTERQRQRQRQRDRWATQVGCRMLHPARKILIRNSRTVISKPVSKPCEDDHDCPLPHALI